MPSGTARTRSCVCQRHGRSKQRPFVWWRDPTDTSNKCYNITDPEPHSPCTRFASDLSDATLGKKRSSTNPRISSSLELLQQYRSTRRPPTKTTWPTKGHLAKRESGSSFPPRGAIFKKGEDAFKDLASVKKA